MRKLLRTTTNTYSTTKATARVLQTVPIQPRRTFHPSCTRLKMTTSKVDAIQNLFADRFGDLQAGYPIRPEQLNIVDSLIDRYTLTGFMTFTSWGILPSGRESSFPLLTVEETKIAVQPYSSWSQHRPGGKDTSPFHRFQFRIGSGPASEADTSRLVWIPKDMHAMKTRLFQGMVPMSGESWARKRLDDPENKYCAYQHLTQVADVFLYLNQPDVQTKLRDTFNLISDDLRDFDRALNAKRQAEGILTPVSCCSLWYEYIEDLFSMVTSRTYSWIRERVHGLKDVYIADFLSVTPDEDNYLPHAIMCLQAITGSTSLAKVLSSADCGMFLPMNNYQGTIAGIFKSVPTIAERMDKYEDKVNAPGVDDELVEIAENRTMAYWGDQERILELLAKSAEMRDGIRAEIRGPASPDIPLTKEMWMTNLESEMFQSRAENWGFVAYRLEYRSDEEWTSYVGKVQHDSSDWGEWVNGADQVKSKAKIHWIDGREVGIPERDVEAAKRHFKSIRNTAAFPRGMSTGVFLAADYDSILSYSSPQSRAVPFTGEPVGSSGGYIQAVDPDFDPVAFATHPRAFQSPGYKGRFHILNSLLFYDFAALLATRTQELRDFWPLAMGHPRQVYVGPTVALQHDFWEHDHQLRQFMLPPAFFDFLRKKEEEGKL